MRKKRKGNDNGVVIATVIIALVFVILIVLGLLVGLLWLTVPVIYDQLIAFSKTITDVITDISGRFDLNLGSYKQAITDTLNELIIA